ncbi:MAG TPA: hypothetical protein VF773_16855 [Verrucomicrobiae bacterium]
MRSAFLNQRKSLGATLFTLAFPNAFSFSYRVPALKGLQPWQIALLIAIAITLLVLCGIIAREMYFAVNPDKRPHKRRRRPKQ